MDIRIERFSWRHDAKKINASIDAAVKGLQDNNMPASQYMAVDLVYRNYAQWLHSARLRKEPPELVRESLILLINSLIIEMAKLMGTLDERGNKIPIDAWITQFVVDLGQELAEDVKILLTTTGEKPQQPS